MDSRSILCFLIVILPLIVVLEANSQNLDELTKSLGGVSVVLNGGSNSDDANPETECLKKLLPCESYLHSSTKPPASCCGPMKEMVANETKCLCRVITNPTILKSFNITQDDALNLAKSCGAKADMSMCKTTRPPTISPTPPASNNSSNSSSSPNSSGNGILPSESAFFIVSLVALFVLSL